MSVVPHERLKRWTDPESFELLDGSIVEKMGQNAPHRICMMLAGRAIATVGVALPLPDVIGATTSLGRDSPKESGILIRCLSPPAPCSSAPSRRRRPPSCASAREAKSGRSHGEARIDTRST